MKFKLFLFLAFGIFLVLDETSSAKSDTASRGIAQVPTAILFIDLNQANEEFEALKSANPGREVIRIPSMTNLAKPQNQVALQKKILGEGLRFRACQISADSACQIATKESSRLAQELIASGWSLSEEINYQLSKVRANISSVYVSGHFNLDKSVPGTIIGKWGKLELVDLSKIFEKNSLFLSLRYISLLSCYFAREGFIQDFLPITQKKPLAVSGYRSTGPLAANPESVQFIKLFSKIDNSFIQKSNSFSFSDSTIQELLTLLKNSGDRRQPALLVSNGLGQYTNFDTTNSVQKAPSSICDKNADRIQQWTQSLIQASISIQQLQTMRKALNVDRLAPCIFRGLQTPQISEFADLFDWLTDLQSSPEELNSFLSSSFKISNATQGRLRELLQKKDLSLPEFAAQLEKLQDDLMSAFDKSLIENSKYEDIRQRVRDLVGLQSSLGPYHLSRFSVDSKLHPDLVVSESLFLLKARHYLPVAEKRRELLKAFLEVNFGKASELQKLQEFGDSPNVIKFNIESEMKALMDLTKDL